MTSPILSVIIPTHNRSAMLSKSLAALSQQTYPADEFEVLVIADACQDDTAEMVANYSPQAGYKLRLYSHDAKSAAATRNLGASQAVGSMLLFLDDDVLPQPGWVQAHVNARRDKGVALGYSKPVLPQEPSWWQYNARLWWEDTYRAMRQPGHRFGYRDFFSGNVSMPAKLFHEVGGFDTTFTGRLEDYELGLRLIKAGARFSFVPEALGYHYDQTDLDLWLSRIHQEGIADVQTGQRHPEMRNIIFSGFEEIAHTRFERARKLIRSRAFNNSVVAEWTAGLLLRLAWLCERLRWRGLWWYITGSLREYQYWRGIAEVLGGIKEFSAWLQEGPVPPAASSEAPVVDLASLPAKEDLQEILASANQNGIRLTLQGMQFTVLSTHPGLESLREEHLFRLLQELADQQFVPALALQLLHLPAGKL